MKVLYGAQNSIGAGIQLKRILDNIPNNIAIKIAAFNKCNYCLKNIDWTLDGLYFNPTSNVNSNFSSMQKIFNDAGTYTPSINQKAFETFLGEVSDFAPDLIISDCEKITAVIAKALQIELWNCSSIGLINKIRHASAPYVYLKLVTRKFYNELPVPNRELIYSPFGQYFSKTNNEWVIPYHSDILTNNFSNEEQLNNEKIKAIAVMNISDRLPILNKLFNCSKYDIDLFSHLNCEDVKNYNFTGNNYEEKLSIADKYFCAGETSYIADALYNNKYVYISPILTDAEMMLNHTVAEKIGAGRNLGVIENFNYLALDKLDETFDKKVEKPNLQKVGKYLHELLI
jgi:uncharacterized protein (TIGR00661 family)